MSTTELQKILRELRKVDKHPELMPSLVKKMEEMNAFYMLRVEFNKIARKESTLPLSDREHVIFIYKLLIKGFNESRNDSKGLPPDNRQES